MKRLTPKEEYQLMMDHLEGTLKLRKRVYEEGYPEPPTPKEIFRSVPSKEGAYELLINRVNRLISRSKKRRSPKLTNSLERLAEILSDPNSQSEYIARFINHKKQCAKRRIEQIKEDKEFVKARDEQVAFTASKYEFNGDWFRLDSFLEDDPTDDEILRFLTRQIDTIPQIVAKIEKEDTNQSGWKIEKGQVFYDGIDLQFPSGNIQEVLQKLIESEGMTVLKKELDNIATGKFRNLIHDIRGLIKRNNVPYEILTVSREGYKLQKKSSHK